MLIVKEVNNFFFLGHNINNGDIMKYYINCLLIYSMFGFIIETTIKYLFNPNMNNGSMYGPWIPIYGLGTCLIIIIERSVFNRLKTNRFLKIICLFLISMIVLTLLEFIGGHLIHLITSKVFWDYSKLKFNIGHYIALEISLVWGIASLIIIYSIKPIVDKSIKKIPSIITYSVLFIFLIDLVISIINN